MGDQKFHIICLKRSRLRDRSEYEFTSMWFKESHVVYWMPNFRGYTDNIDEAGQYDHWDLKTLNGTHLDWFIVAVKE